ncbi:MAG: cyclodeaminase/cyclohydrolase family protein [Thermacetogeniaceae bacterium]
MISKKKHKSELDGEGNEAMSNLPDIRELRIPDYLTELASDSLFPSAGAAAAITGAQAAALFAMVCRVNLRKLRGAKEGKCSGDFDSQQLAFWERSLELASSWTKRFLELAQEDGVAYREVVEGKPEGASHSIEVPLEIGRRCGDLAELIETAMPLSYPPVRPDAETSLCLAQGTKKAALAIARSNLILLKQKSERKYYFNQIEELSK